MADVAAARACDRLRGTFRPIQGGEEAGAVGTLWIEECEVTASGTDVTLQLSGRGWRWIFRQKEEAGATFEVSEHARFAYSVLVRGTMDAAYEPEEHIATIWFTPKTPPEVTFDPIGEVDVETEGAWSSVVSGLASAFAESPSDRAVAQLAARGKSQFQEKFAGGIAATIDLCTGEAVTGFGHPAQGEMLSGAAASPAVEATMHPDGLLLSGPHETSDGPVRVVVQAPDRAGVSAQLMCQAQAARLAEDYLHGRPPTLIEPLASQEVHGRAELRAPAGSCPVVVATRVPAGAAPPISYRYTVDQPGEQPEPLAICPADDSAPAADGGPPAEEG